MLKSSEITQKSMDFRRFQAVFYRFMGAIQKNKVNLHS